MTSASDLGMDRSAPTGASIGARGRLARNPLFYVQVAVILLLAGMIVYPLAMLLSHAFLNNDGEYTTRWFVDAFSRRRNFEAISNTFIIAASVAVVSTISGTFLAWAVVRTDMPGAKIVELTSIIPFVTSSFIGAMAWIMLASPEVGLLNEILKYAGFERGPFNIYSISGIVFVQALYDTPLVFIMVAAALRSVDSSLEEASLSSGAGYVRTMSRITLPLVMPAIIASGLLVFVMAAEQYGVPAVLGTPANIRVLTTTIVDAQTRYPPALGLGAALSTILLVLALVMLWVQRWILRNRTFATVGGKSSRSIRISLGAGRGIVLAICLLYVAMSVILPFGTLLLSSVRKLWTPEFSWSELTLEHYRWVLFEYPITQRAITNSIVLAIAGATLGMILASIVAFLTLRIRLPGAPLLEYLAVIPLGFPGVVLAFAFLQAWISPPLVLYGTFWILLLAYITTFLPVGVRSVSATIVQIHPELEEASLSSGANWFQTFGRVTLPLLRPGFVAGWSLLFILCMRELSSSVLLYTPTREVLAVAIYDLRVGGEYRELSALSVIQIAIALSLLGLVKWASSGKREALGTT